jgi:uncharacterized membrane protein (DUF485 family)
MNNSADPPPPPPPLQAPNARLGLVLFAIYLAAYGGFMGLCTFALPTMAEAPWGVNWAVLYGFGLIVGAFVLAMIYMALCRSEHADAIPEKNSGGRS